MGELFNHVTAPLSELEREMVPHIPPGGNWRNIPEHFPSARLAQIRAMTKKRGVVRTTYYGRLAWGKPAYTISTYFHRIGNGCFLHPSQDRLISLREGARLQSFPDSFRFLGPRTSIYRQVGNAVPPLLAYHVARGIRGKTLVSLFAGAGGFSLGCSWAGYTIVAANDSDKHAAATYSHNMPDAKFIVGDIRSNRVKELVLRACRDSGGVDVVAGGPPCQGFSMAGWHDPRDPRNLLPREFISVVGKLQPAYFVMENVEGLLWMEKGKVYETILAEFRHLGYSVVGATLKAEEFGVPQRRRRVFVVGGLGEMPRLPEPVMGRGKLTLPGILTVRDAISDLPPLEAGGGEDVVSYNEDLAMTSYQQWARGRKSVDKLISAKSPPWSGESLQPRELPATQV